MTSDNSSNEEPTIPLELQEGTPPYEILQLLAKNDEQVFTQAEIHEAADIESHKVGTVLPRLEKRGLVRQSGGHWQIGEDDRLASYASQRSASSVSITDDYYNGESSDEFEEIP